MSVEINEDALGQIKELMGERFPSLVDTYVNSNREHVAKLRQGLADGDAQMIVDSAHPMKSSAGNMGLAGLSASATELEAQAKEVVASGQGIETLGDLVSKIEEQFVAGEAYLKSCL